MHTFKKLFYLLGGGLFCLISAVGLVERWEMFWHWEVTEGTVVAVDVTPTTSSRLGAEDLVAPHLEFTDQSGQTHRVISSSSSDAPDTVGDVVEVIYDPNDPQTAIHNGFIDVWFTPVFVGVLGLLLLYFGISAKRLPSSD